MIDFYELLGISMDSTKQEIKTAYREMVKKYHPDVNKSEDSNKIIRSLNEAKEVLLDDEKRKEYDKLLNDIKYSKQFSKEKDETYTAKTEEYKENYSENYVTKWQFFINYISNGIDKVWLKILKVLLVIINFFFFCIVKLITFVLIFLLSTFSGIIDYFSGILSLISIVALFALKNSEYPDFIPLIPANVEGFFLIFLIALIIELLKTAFITYSVNIFALICNIEDKIFIKILMK
mgnify:FL=1